MNCPRCNQPLAPHQASRITLHGCVACGGVFLDSESSRKVVDAVDPAVVAEADRESQTAHGGVDLNRVAACPACNAQMQQMPIREAGVVVDACPAHGVWFDRDELQRVIRTVAPQRTTPTPMAPQQQPQAMQQPQMQQPPAIQQPQMQQPQAMQQPQMQQPQAMQQPQMQTTPSGVPYVMGAPLAAAASIAQPAMPTTTPSGVPYIMGAANPAPQQPQAAPQQPMMGGVPYVAGSAAPAQSQGVIDNPAARFFTDGGGGGTPSFLGGGGAPAGAPGAAPAIPGVPGAPGAPGAPGGGWSMGKTALAVGGGVVAAAGVGYMVTHAGKTEHMFGEVGEVLSKLM